MERFAWIFEKTTYHLTFFKRPLFNFYATTTVPYYYPKGHRNVQVLHTRMRTESSCLNACLDSLTCRRGQVEDNTHYLFQCQLCLTPRKVLLDSIVPLLPTNIQCSTLLFSHGHSELTIETNNLLFENVYTLYKIHKTNFTIDLIHRPFVHVC